MEVDPAGVLDDLFDPAKGWPFSAEQVPLQKRTSHDGNPCYVANLDGIDMLVFQQNQWEHGLHRSAPPGRLVAMTVFSGVRLTNPTALLVGSYKARGLPSCGINDQGQITLHAAFPYAEEVPLNIARKQLMVCMGLVAEEAKDLLRAWTANSGATSGWEVAKEVASMAGAFLRAFIGH